MLDADDQTKTRALDHLQERAGADE
jgi:hypothetical protein